MQSLSPEPLLSEEDYGAIEAAVMETARGRWFLAEYARRNRNADTEAVLAAIRRLERLVHSAGALDARDEVTRGMADIAQAIAAAQSAPASVAIAANATSAPMETSSALADHRAGAEAQVFGQIEAAKIDEIEPAFETGPEAAADAPRPAIAETVQDTPGLESTTPVEADALAPVASSPSEPEQRGAEAETESADRAWEGLERAATEIAALGLPPELKSPDGMEIVRTEGADEQAAPEIAATAIERHGAVSAPSGGPAEPEELFPILELDEEATEALLTLDVPRQELILPPNHLATQRWHKELVAGEETAQHRLDKWTAISGKGGGGADPSTTNGERDKVLDMVAVVEEALEPAPASGLVTFIDEEPAEEEQSIFTAPLRLEPEAVVDTDAAAVIVRKPAAAAKARDLAPRLTLGEIEAMPFAKKAALFS
ncbi:hypothetical protein J8I29_26270 [Labrys sp. LIt4]|uniref:hypothetical protein n=1 Tax=Labrys sp. LIt4 TaxID=2821355 RepID=UPI001ADEF8EC|nr:hypothetical protein [Labrys sp. LIt4]MBP0582860.1 hypothetical protein [Labrys sp. LIt4]